MEWKFCIEIARCKEIGHVLFVRGNDDLHIDRYFILLLLLLLHFATRVYIALVPIRLSFFIFRSRSVLDPAGVQVPVSC